MAFQELNKDKIQVYKVTLSGIITIKNLKCSCVIGAHTHERTAEQELWFDLELEGDFSRACLTDNLDDTIDYASVAEAAVRIAKKTKSRLLEHLAYNINQYLLSNWRQLQSSRIKIKKVSAIPSAQYAEFTLKNTRENL